MSTKAEVNGVSLGLFGQGGRVWQNVSPLLTLHDSITILQAQCRDRVLEREGASLVTVQELVRLLESDGWKQVKEEGLMRQFKHDAKPGTVTLSGKVEKLLPPGLLRTLLRYAQIQEES